MFALTGAPELLSDRQGRVWARKTRAPSASARAGSRVGGCEKIGHRAAQAGRARAPNTGLGPNPPIEPQNRVPPAKVNLLAHHKQPQLRPEPTYNHLTSVLSPPLGRSLGSTSNSSDSRRCGAWLTTADCGRMAHLSPVEWAVHSTAGSSERPGSSRRGSSVDSFETSFTSLTSRTVIPPTHDQQTGAPVLDSPELGRGIMSGDWGFASAGKQTGLL